MVCESVHLKKTMLKTNKFACKITQHANNLIAKWKRPNVQHVNVLCYGRMPEEWMVDSTNFRFIRRV